MSSLKLSLGIIFTSALLIWYLIWSKPLPEVDLEEIVALKVLVGSVQNKDIYPYETVMGRLYPQKTAKLHFEVSGVVQKRVVEPGHQVSTGDFLISLEQADYQDQLVQAQASMVIETQTQQRDRELLQLGLQNLALQEKELRRLYKIAEKNLIAHSKVDEMRQRVFDLQAEVARLQAAEAMSDARILQQQSRVDSAQRNLDRTQLQAPFVGVINEVHIDQGDYVGVNQMALSMIDITHLDVQLDVRGELVQGLNMGDAVQVTHEAQTVAGEIVALQADPDVNTNTHQVRVRVSGQNLYAGALARVSLPLPAQMSALVIPVTAVLNQYGTTYVYLFEDDSVYLREIEIGKRVADEYVVMNGLEEGQQIVLRDVVSLVNQQAVTAEY
jgi:multidrug efflux system membrane fusion protein